MAFGRFRIPISRILGPAIAVATVCFAAWIALSLLSLSASSLPLKALDLRLASKAQIQSFLNATGSSSLDTEFHSAQDSEEATQGRKLFLKLRIAFETPPDERVILELKKLHPSQWQVWLSNLTPSGVKFYTRLPLESGTRGSLVDLPASLIQAEVDLLLEAKSPSARRPKIRAWSESELSKSENYARYLNGSAMGILLFLTAFGTIIAIIAKDKTFLYFGAWSFVSLRTIAVNEGWATGWLFDTLSEKTLPIALAGSLSLYGLFTALLFRSLFERELRFSLNGRLLNVVCAAFVLMAVLAPLWESPYYYRTVWAISGLAMLLVASSFLFSLGSSSSNVYRWYAAFWVTMLAGLGGEIAYTAGLFRAPHALLNVQTGTVASAMLMAITVAQRFLVERIERQRAQEAEIHAMQDLANTYESMPIGLFRMDESGAISLHNAAFSEMFQLSTSDKKADLRAQSLFGAAGFDALLDLYRASTGDSRATIIVCCDDGSDARRHLQFTARRGDGCLEGSVQDVTARVTAEASLARLIDHDPQTKALNQRGLNDAVKRAMQMAASGVPCALVELDIDRFKTLNDLYGHLVGDQLLSAVCDRLIVAAGPNAEIARIGDSFRIVLFRCDAQGSVAAAERMHRAVSNQPLEVAGRILTVSASVGVVPFEHGMDVRDVIAASSQACAEAKSRGRNRVVHMARQDMALRGYLEELKVQENLQDKLNSQRFYLEFQPIVSFRSAFETLNYEVLVRMRGEDGATISPGRFIPAAERNGQMSLIDRWVLLKTLHWLQDHPHHLKRLDYATINLSGASLNDARFVDNIFAMMSEFPGVLSKLCFEITETVALADRRATRRFSERLHSMGGRIALDDFGAGYTSFTYLREIEADIIKIDGSFVRDINQNPANFAITRMIVELSHELGKRCVAEWAEHPDVIATLMQLGVDFGQGYALARPMAPEALIFAGSSGDLVTQPNVRALLKGTISPEQVAAGTAWSAGQPALF